MRLKQVILLLTVPALASCAVLGWGPTLWAAEPDGAPPSKPLFSQTIEPLYDKAENGKRTPQLEDLNQCAGTMQRYRLPPTGYVAAKENASSKGGAKLYEQLNCASCHMLKGKGGMLGPPLDGIGGHRGKQWLEARLLDPETQMREFPEVFGGRPNIMPHPGVTRKQASQLANYLLTLPEPSGGFLITAHPTIDEEQQQKVASQNEPARERIEKGRDAFAERGCAMCHSINSAGGRFGPSLDNISRKYAHESLVLLLTGKAKGDTMKATTRGIEKEEAERIADFLYTLQSQKKPAEDTN